MRQLNTINGYNHSSYYDVPCLMIETTKERLLASSESWWAIILQPAFRLGFIKFHQKWLRKPNIRTVCRLCVCRWYANTESELACVEGNIYDCRSHFPSHDVHPVQVTRLTDFNHLELPRISMAVGLLIGILYFKPTLRVTSSTLHSGRNQILILSSFELIWAHQPCTSTNAFITGSRLF